MILSLLLAVVLSDAEQAKHDADERALQPRLVAVENRIATIWRPRPKLLSELRRAARCYTQFHLYKVEAAACDAELTAIELDLDALAIPK